ncbi:hypothetical protein [Photobacterium rosenbergii]|uniref:hypothetical protein n=1 Tax=Photobacterium rosenbergii TaxID=294936 RepID=UPI001C997249|nr:hypothetical protein [Photobacterium rosenbergii]MBY5948784.1 hypothetical protein [Photobacterium rosenbergii]
MNSVQFWVTILTAALSMLSFSIAFLTFYYSHIRKKVSAFGMLSGMNTKTKDRTLSGEVTIVIANDGNQPLLIDRCYLLAHSTKNLNRSKAGNVIKTPIEEYDLSEDKVLNPNEIRKYIFNVPGKGFFSDKSVGVSFSFRCASTNKKYMNLDVSAEIFLNPKAAENKSLTLDKDKISILETA